MLITIAATECRLQAGELARRLRALRHEVTELRPAGRIPVRGGSWLERAKATRELDLGMAAWRDEMIDAAVESDVVVLMEPAPVEGLVAAAMAAVGSQVIVMGESDEPSLMAVLADQVAGSIEDVVAQVEAVAEWKREAAGARTGGLEMVS